MATMVPGAGQIPFSNRAGNNQFSGAPKANPVMPTGPMPGAVTQNPTTPYTPVNPGAIPRPLDATGQQPITGATVTGTGGAQVPNAGGLTNSPANTSGTTGALQKQLVDIFGKGTGGALASLLANMSGIDSATLQEFIQSLQPQMAKAGADLGASLGAAGVSANSSVNAIAQGDLQAQEFAAISGESAKLTQSQEELTAQILEATMPAAQKQVATSGWSVFADVMNNITGDIGNLSGGNFHNATPGGNPGVPNNTLGSTGYGDFSQDIAPDSSGLQASADSLSYPSSPDMSIFGLGDSLPQ